MNMKKSLVAAATARDERKHRELLNAAASSRFAATRERIRRTSEGGSQR